MSWIDITRNIRDSNNLTGNYQKIPRDLFTLNKTLYAVVQVQSRAPGTSTSNYVYSVFKHLGSDPPVVDVIWSNVGKFAPIAGTSQYKNAGKVVNNGIVYLGNSETGQVYYNTTSNTIDGNWGVINGPFGKPEYSETAAGLSSLVMYNNALYAGHKGGVSKYNSDTRLWSLVGEFAQGPDAVGYTQALYVFQSELYAGIAYNDVCIIYKWNESITNVNKWIKVAELPPESTEVIAITEYQNEFIVIAKSPNKNIFRQSDIGINYRGVLQFLEGDHLLGIPSSATTYKPTSSSTLGLWVTCTDSEASTTDDLLGDLDGNAIIDISDVQYLASLGTTIDDYPQNTEVTDVNGDGVLDIVDIVSLIRYIADPNLLYDNGPLTDLPYDTKSRNKIVSISEDDSETTPIPLVFDLKGFTNPIGTGAFSARRMWSNDSSLDTGIIIPQSQGTKYVPGYERNVWTPESQLSVNKHWVINSNALGPIDAETSYTISVDISTTALTSAQVMEGFTGTTSPGLSDRVAKTTIFMGLVTDPKGGPFTGFSSGGGNLAPATTPTFNTLPWYGKAIRKGAPDQYRWSTTLTYTFAGHQLSYPQNASWYLRIVGQDNELGGLIIYRCIMGALDAYCAYAPDITLSNFTISYGKGVILGASYISKLLSNVPTDEIKNHSIVSPSGPDEWFIKSPGIYNQIAPELRKPSKLLPYSAGIYHPFITNNIEFEPGEEYSFRLITKVPASSAGSVISIENGKPTHVYAKLLDADGNYIFNYSRVVSWSDNLIPIDIAFNVPSDLSSDTVKSLSVEFGAYRYQEDVSLYDDDIVNSPDVYFSDINLTKRLQGSPGNYIYKFQGDKWTQATTSIADPAIYSRVPRKSLVSNYDSRSQASQIYSVGGAAVWVWNYQGGRYSGSKYGPELDIRPQIISIM